MDQEDVDAENHRLKIKKLREKMKSLVSDVDLFREVKRDELILASKFPENDVHCDYSDVKSLDGSRCDEDEDEFIDFSQYDLEHDTTWLSSPDETIQGKNETPEEICRALYWDIGENVPDISDLCLELQISAKSSTASSSDTSIAGRRGLIDSRTFTRPKKCMSRASLGSLSSEDDGRLKLQRRLTTTITPTPNLISKLEELSKVNNRPVSGNYSDVNWEDGSEGLAESPKNLSKRRSVPASLLDRLQELKKSNNSPVSKLETRSSGNIPNGKIEDSNRGGMMDDVKKITASFDLNAQKSTSASRMSEIFRNIPEYVSDDNESFISLDEVSSFCDRLTHSTDQSTYSAIIREMEQKEMCLFHRTSLGDRSESRITFGGKEIPAQLLVEDVNTSGEQFVDNILDVTFDVDEKAIEKANRTFDLEKNEMRMNEMNSTFDIEKRGNKTFDLDRNEIKRNSLCDAEKRGNRTFDVDKNVVNAAFDGDKKPGIMDVLMQSNIIKNFTPNYNNKNICGDKTNVIYNRNEINSINNEKYTSRIFDATFGKSPGKFENQTEKSNGKKDSDHSEDDCMSTTSDNSYRSVESNSEQKNFEELKSIAIQQNRRLSETKFSTPKSEAERLSRISRGRHSDEWRTLSPIRKEDDCGSQGSSNASSRGTSPRVSAASSNQGLQQKRANNVVSPTSVRQPFKVAQRELKLKPALIRPTQNFKRPQPVNNNRTVSEPSVACKADSPPTSMPLIRAVGLPFVPSQPCIRPTPRMSGIPRPPSRLKQPQIRSSDVMKK